jgi:hypothetical protein
MHATEVAKWQPRTQVLRSAYLFGLTFETWRPALTNPIPGPPLVYGFLKTQTRSSSNPS